MLHNISSSFLYGALAIIFAAILWSVDGILIRPNFYSFPAINIVFMEHVLWALLLSPFLFLGYKKLKEIQKWDIFSILWVSLFWWLIWTYFITEAYFSAFRWEASLSTVIILQKLQPFFALWLAAIILKERLSKWFYLWAATAIFSAYMITYWALWKDFFSIDIFSSTAFYAFLAAFAFGSSTVFGKRLVTNLGFRLSTALRFLVTSLLAFIVIVLVWSFEPFTQFEKSHFQLFWIIVFTSGAWALFLYYYWLKKVSASNATIFELAWPLSWIFFDWYFNESVLNTTQILFSILLLISFFMIIEEHKEKNHS